MSKRQIITLTDKAFNKLFDILKKTNNSNIEFYLKGGGCNGFNYHLVPTNNLPNKDDEVVKLDKFNIHICNNSLLHILGTNIDWKEGVMEQKFVFNNPIAQSNCGCGSSFTSKAL
tara:strand:+ start:2767 stop:3111 length:345 start_codon:yes stop_codon:yes gene_type:complete